MSKHTPGPWTISPPWSGFSEIRGAKDELIFGLAAGASDERRPEDEIEANAGLIAAAPEMLDQLKECVRYLLLEGSGVAGHLVDQINDVIAKAEGRS